VINPDGSMAGWQDKEQIDPSEERLTWPAGAGECSGPGLLTFGVVMRHEGWRYPETVRWVARRGARCFTRPHAHAAEPESYRPAAFLDPANTFHEKAMLRAAEDTC
jgi:predicted amidohydrolase